MLNKIGKESLLSNIIFNSLTTLSIKGFFSGIRADHDMPTVVEYAYKRARCVQDNIIRIYQKNFSYFIGPSSYYLKKIIKVQDPPNMANRRKKKHDGIVIPKAEEEVLKDFARENGKGVRQLNVRSKTKEQIGMLPYAVITRPNVISPSEFIDDVVSAAEECGVLRRGAGASTTDADQPSYW